jgi:hypothetical protein
VARLRAAWRGVGSQHANANLAFGAADYLSVMSAPLTSVQWLVRAEDARLDSAAVNDPQVKRMMLVMAAGYERLTSRHSFVIATRDHVRSGSKVVILAAMPAVSGPRSFW